MAYSDPFKQYEVDTKKYRNNLRIYLDVDGVITPYYNHEQGAPEGYRVAQLNVDNYNLMNSGNPTQAVQFAWNESVIERLAVLSHNPKVDLVWLTAWKHNAPKHLDLLLNITSLGFLDWSIKLSDYTQVFKKVAIEEDQELNPSQFIWVDDIANRTDYGYHSGGELFSKLLWDEETGQASGEYEVIIAPERYLTITPNSFVGLTHSNMDDIEAYVLKHQK